MDDLGNIFTVQKLPDAVWSKKEVARTVFQLLKGNIPPKPSQEATRVMHLLQFENFGLSRHAIAFVPQNPAK